MPRLARTGDSDRLRRLTPKSIASGVAFLCDQDRDLAAIVDRHGPPAVRLRRPGFTTLAGIIVEQQVSLASGRAIWQRLSDGLGGVTPENVAARNAESLRRLGLSRQKASYVFELARGVMDGTIDLGCLRRLEDDLVREALTRIRGVGRWTADIYLLTAMGRPDVWPRGDLALDVALGRVKGLDGRPDAGAVEALTAAWAPWRSVAARILWHGYVNDAE